MYNFFNKWLMHIGMAIIIGVIMFACVASVYAVFAVISYIYEKML